MAQLRATQLRELRGQVILVNFWTITCVNCVHTEPYVRAGSRAYRDDGLVLIGVHTPEFSFEHKPCRLRAATDGNGVLDNGRMYQLVRQHDAIHDRTLEITFDERGAEAYAFTSG